MGDDEYQKALREGMYGPSDVAEKGVERKPREPREEEVAEESESEEVYQSMGEDAAEIFAEAFAARRQAPPPEMKPKPEPEPAPVVERVRTARQEEKKAPPAFAESVAPWTLCKGFGVILMLTYIVGFHGRRLADSWGPLLVISVAVAAVVLMIDYARSTTNRGKSRAQGLSRPPVD